MPKQNKTNGGFEKMSCCNLYPNILPDNCDFVECLPEGNEVTARTLDVTFETPTISGLNPGQIAKVPVWLGRVILTGIIRDDISFADGFSEIKEISRKVYITQCKYFRGNVIVEGYIIKDIRYVRPIDEGVNTNRCIAYDNAWFDRTVKVPFSFAQRVNLNEANLPTEDESTREEFNYLCDTMSHQCCDKGYMGPSPCETLRVETHHLNERPYCELNGYRIVELGINRFECEDDFVGDCCCPPAPRLFRRFTEKLSLDLCIDFYVLGWGKPGSLQRIPLCETLADA